MPEALLLPGIAPPPIAPLAPIGDPDGLRPYQRDAVNAWSRDLSEVRGALGVMFTGGGKTRTAGALVRPFPGRVLWLANRDFLIDQASERLQQMTGEWISTEKAELRSSGTRIVIGSQQTLKGKRLAQMPDTMFDLIVPDEAHHCVSPGYMQIFEHFGGAKIAGMTATPFRLDKIGLRNVFERTSFEYDIRWGMDEGYFCPVVPIRHDVDEIDLSAIKTVAGDLEIGKLEEQIIRAAAQIARIAYEESEHGKLPFMVYTPGVASAHAVSKTLCELGGEYFSTSVDQETPKWKRRQILSSFGASLRGIANCQIYTEGLDVPLARCIIIARLTESLSLYQQIAGRGGRTEAGCSEKETKEERIAAIANSSKPWFKLVDITGKAGRHALITSVNALAGKDVPHPIIEAASEIIRSTPGFTLDEAIKKAKAEAVKKEREELEANAKRIAEAASKAEVKSRRSEFDPWNSEVSENDGESIAPEWLQQKPTAEQLHWLRENKLPEDISRGEAARLQKQAKQWRKLGMASFKQRRILERKKLPIDIPSAVATRLIKCLESNHWNAKRAKRETDRILSDGRQAGED